MKRLAGMLLVVLALGGMVLAQSALLINGAGATFPYPIIRNGLMSSTKKNGNIQINYQSIGSGGGIRQITEGQSILGHRTDP